MTRESLLHVFHLTFGDHATFVQDRDAPGDRTHKIHIVLDHHHGMFAGKRLQQLGRALDLLRGHAGNRLVHQEQLRLLHQQHADLEPLLLAVGQCSSQRLVLLREADDFEDLVDSVLLFGRSAKEEGVQERLVAGQAPVRGSRTP